MSEKSYVDGLIERAKAAQKIAEGYTQEQIDAVVKAIGKVIFDHAEEIAKEAVEETGYGRVDSKILKVQRCTTAAWHYMHDKKSVGMIEWDPEEKLATFAKPLGIVAALVPTTNPVSTAASNGMSILKCRNAMIVSPHPRALKTTIHGVELMRGELKKLNAPEDLIQVVDQPSMDSTNELMKKVDVVVATGGAPMVKSAYSSGRPSFGVGPGNSQVLLAPDYTDYAKLAAQIVFDRSYDNGMPCTTEQALHLPKEKVDEVLKAFEEADAFLLPDDKAKDLIGVFFTEDMRPNPKNVGMLPQEIGKAIGVDVPDSAKILVFKSIGMGDDNVLRREKMNPVLQYFPYDSYEEGVANAKANLEWEGAGHSSIIYTNEEKYAEYAALELPVGRLIVNQPGGAASGGSGTNGLLPTMSLGCGSWGNNSISENLTYRHMMNVTRLAYYHDPSVPAAEEVWAE